MLIVNWLIVPWVSITVLLFISFVPNVRKRKDEQWSHITKQVISSTNNLTSLFYKFFYFLLSLFIAFCFFVVLFIIPHSALQMIIKFCNFSIVVTFLSLILPYITQNNQGLTLWHWLLIIDGLLVSAISHFIDGSTNIISQNHRFSCIVLSLFIWIAIYSCLGILRSNFNIKIKKSNIRKDLFYRTPNFEINNISCLQLIKMCEEYYCEYFRCYKKINKIKKVEFVSLYIHNEDFYIKASKITKYFWCISFMICIFFITYHPDLKSLIMLFSLLIFLIEIKYLKIKDKLYLHRLATDFFYNIYGYCLFLNVNKNSKKFVGTVQMFDNSKYHKFVHSFLNIAALCRATAFNDRNNKEQKIKILTSNIYDLCTFYEDSNNSDWIKLLPLWITALFEFYVTDEVSEIVRSEFNKICVYKKQGQEVYIFLSGFWVDMTRNMPNDKSNNFINRFMSEIGHGNNT